MPLKKLQFYQRHDFSTYNSCCVEKSVKEVFNASKEWFASLKKWKVEHDI